MVSEPSYRKGRESNTDMERQVRWRRANRGRRDIVGKGENGAKKTSKEDKGGERRTRRRRKEPERKLGSQGHC